VTASRMCCQANGIVRPAISHVKMKHTTENFSLSSRLTQF
jgi:hypothetical protein